MCKSNWIQLVVEPTYLKDMQPSNCIISPSRGEIKNVWNHHPGIIYPQWLGVNILKIIDTTTCWRKILFILAGVGRWMDFTPQKPHMELRSPKRTAGLFKKLLRLFAGFCSHFGLFLGRKLAVYLLGKVHFGPRLRDNHKGWVTRPLCIETVKMGNFGARKRRVHSEISIDELGLEASVKGG